MLKNLFFGIVLLCTLKSTAQTTVGLVGYFPFNGNYSNSGSATASASGVNTAFTTNVCNTTNSAVQFQGNVNSYIDFTDNGNFDFSGTQNFTIAFSFFFNGSSTSGLVDNSLNYGGWGVWLWSTVPGTWNLQFNYKGNSVGSAAATNFTPGSWHHATAVRNNGTISLYIDGVFRLSATEGGTVPSYPINMQAGVMTFSSFTPPRYNPFGGKIDELRIYNRALSAAEIQVLSNAALLSCCSTASILAVSGPSTLCAGGTANLTTTITGGVSPYTVVYTDGATNFTVNNYVNGSNIPVTPSGTTTYSLVSVTDANSCTGTGNSGTPTVTVTPLPAAAISYAGSPYCSNSGTATVTRTGTAGGTYSSTAGLTINPSTGDITLGSSTPGTYTVIYTIAASGGCPAVTATTTVTITQLPAVSISYAGSPYCSNAGTVTVTRTGTAGGTYSSTAGLTINATTGDVTLGTSTPGTYTVTYTLAASGGCAAVTAATTITITALPAATIAYSATPYCSNAGTVTVTRTGTAGGTYSSTAGLTINGTTGDVTLGTSTPGTYTVTYTLAASGGCAAVTAATTITITALPAATISYAGSPYCSNAGTAAVTMTGTPGGTYSSTAGLTINSTTGNITLGSSTPGTYTVTYTIAASGGCPAVTATTTVTITQLPAATISYAGSPYCSNAGTATVNRTGTAGGTYSATPIGLTINATTGDVTLGSSTPGTYTVTYMLAASGGCSALTATSTITITQLPVATISYGGSPYCSNAGTASVTMTGTPGGTYSSTAGLTINPSTGDVTLATSTPGVYTVTYSIAGSGGCSAVSATTTIIITSVPSATIVYTGSPYCSNAGTATVTRTGTSGGTYSAIPAGLSINPVTGNVTLGTSTPGTYTVTYTIAASGGCPAFLTTAAITITATTSATISYSGSPYCSTTASAPVTLTGASGGTYSATPAGLTINSSTGVVTPATSIPGTYTVNYTLVGCATFIATTSITITAAPGGTIFYAGTPYCSNAGTATVSQFGTTGGTYSASPAGLSINATTGAVNTGASAAGIYTVTYTMTAAGCGTTITTTTIAITAAPNATINYAGSPYCSSAGTADITLTGTTGGVYAASPAGLSINASTGAVNLAASNAGIYTVTYSIAASGGCASYATTSTITITELPAATIAYTGSPYCSNAGTATVSRTGTAGGAYSASPPGLSMDATSGAVNLSTSTAGTYTVTYSIAAGSGCPAVIATTSITITALPVATITYTANPYCANSGTATVTRTGAAGGTYSASPAGLNINATTGTVTLATSTPGTYTVSYTIAASGGCGAVTATTPITVNALSTDPVAATASATTLCGTGTVTLSVTGGSLGAGASWKWYNGTCAGTLVGTGTTLNVTVNSTTTYFVRAEGTCNTTSCASVTITVNTQPTISIAASATMLKPGQTSTLTASVTPATGNTITWYRNGNAVATGTTMLVNADNLGTYTARAATANGCTALSDALNITAEATNRLYITANPNNGQFKVQYYTSENHPAFLRHLVIYSEKGQKVYDKVFRVTAPYSSMDVDVSHVAKGLYIVMITDAFGNEILETGKVIIQ